MNIVLLVVGPLVVGGLVLSTKLSGRLYWSAKGWGRAPVALAIGFGVNIALAFLYIRLNPFVRLPGLFLYLSHADKEG